MSYQPRAHWKNLPKTRVERTVQPNKGSNRAQRRMFMKGGQGLGPIAVVMLKAATRRRRPLDPAPWETGNTLGNSLMRNHEAAHRAARA